jgi:outer membrane cobalamin receptor
MTTPLLAQEEQKEEDIEDFSLEDLLNVEITTAGKQAEKISEIPASIVLVTRDDIEKYGYQSLSEILENIPGLYYTNDYGTENFGVRGFWTIEAQRNIIVLVNGVQQAEFLVGAHQLEQINIPPEAIDRIEVVRGPMSVIYGTGAFFGVINIKTNVIGDKPVSAVSASFGSEKTKQLFVRASGKEGDFQYAFNASYYDTAGLDADLSKMGPFAGTTEGALENDEKYFNFSGKFKGFTFNASYSQAYKESIFVLPPVDDATVLDYKSTRFSFTYEKSFSDKVRGDVKLTYFRNYWTFDYDLAASNLYAFQTNGSSGYRAELNFFFDPSPKLNISIGFDYNKVLDVVTQVDIPLFALNKQHTWLADGESIVTQSIFAQFNYKLSDKFKIVIGARLEQSPEYTMEQLNGDAIGFYSTTTATYSQTEAEFIPRVALIYSINDNNILKFLYGKAINRPSFFQSTELLAGATALQPETIQTFEFNYLGSLSPKLQVSLSLFRNMLDQLIFRSLTIVNGQVVSLFDNVGEMTTNGVELTLTAKPSGSFFMELSGTYQDTKDKRPGLEDITPGYAPKFLGYLKASYFLNKDISLAVTGNYVGEMEALYDDLAEARLGAPVDGYFLLGANLRFRRLFGSGMFLNIRGSNLLDKEIFYPTTSNNLSYAPNGTIARGLSFLFTLGWKF